MLEVVFIDEFLWENPFLKLHVFEFVHHSSEIEVFEVDSKEAATRSRYDAVEEYFRSGGVCIRRVGFSSIFKFIATNSNSDMIWVSFLGTVVGDDASICGFLVLG